MICELTVEDGQCRLLNLAPRSQPQAGRLLIGRLVDEALALLPNIVPVCGRAHSLAMLGAVESALGIEITPAQAAARDVIALLETAVNVAWRLAIDWPALIGQPPQPERVAAVKRAGINVAAALGLRPRWSGIDCPTSDANARGAEPALGALRRELKALFPEATAVASLDQTLDAMRVGSSVPARMIAATLTPEFACLGDHDAPLLETPNAAWFKQRLCDEEFGDRPTVDGLPAEVGPLCDAPQPIMQAAMARWGRNLTCRLLAAALQSIVVEERLRRAVLRLEADDRAPARFEGRGTGSAVVETARGPLAYYVAVANGRIMDIRSAAPTEWNFHPRGPFVQALARVERTPNPEYAVRLLARSFDPCVPLHVKLANPQPSIKGEALLHA